MSNYVLTQKRNKIFSMHRLYVLVFIVLSTAFGNYTAMREMKTNPVERPGGKTPKTACRLL